jgi:hypothetical protein
LSDDVNEMSAPHLPPPIGLKKIKNLVFYSDISELVKFWNKLIQNNTVIFTNECLSFYIDSIYIQYFQH